MISPLLRAHPQLRIDLELTDRVIDIVSSGLDLAIRIARLRDNSLVARRLAPSPRLLCAAPDYIAERGAPHTLEALADHECLALTGVTHWAFEARRVRIGGRFSASSIDGILEACLNGAGIALLAEWNVREDLRRGRLIALDVEGATAEELSIWAVYPTARMVLPKLRVFVSALEAALTSA